MGDISFWGNGGNQTNSKICKAKIILSVTQPIEQSENDFWLEILESEDTF